MIKANEGRAWGLLSDDFAIHNEYLFCAARTPFPLYGNCKPGRLYDDCLIAMGANHFVLSCPFGSHGG
jgi:hypothetical protein